MIDGMDIAILTYVAPAIQADWDGGATRLGIVFSMGLAGMAIGGSSSHRGPTGSGARQRSWSRGR